MEDSPSNSPRLARMQQKYEALLHSVKAHNSTGSDKVTFHGRNVTSVDFIEYLTTNPASDYKKSEIFRDLDELCEFCQLAEPKRVFTKSELLSLLDQCKRNMEHRQPEARPEGTIQPPTVRPVEKTPDQRSLAAKGITINAHWVKNMYPEAYGKSADAVKFVVNKLREQDNFGLLPERKIEIKALIKRFFQRAEGAHQKERPIISPHHSESFLEENLPPPITRKAGKTHDGPSHSKAPLNYLLSKKDSGDKESREHDTYPAHGFINPDDHKSGYADPEHPYPYHLREEDMEKKTLRDKSLGEPISYKPSQDSILNFRPNKEYVGDMINTEIAVEASRYKDAANDTLAYEKDVMDAQLEAVKKGVKEAIERLEQSEKPEDPISLIEERAEKLSVLKDISESAEVPEEGSYIYFKVKGKWWDVEGKKKLIHKCFDAAMEVQESDDVIFVDLNLISESSKDSSTDFRIYMRGATQEYKYHRDDLTLPPQTD